MPPVTTAAARPAPNAPVTVLIPTYNRVRALRAVWPCYVGHPLVARLVVVDDGSTDGTSALVRQIAAASPTPVTLVTHPEKRGQQAARLTAIAAADTEWVFFGEDDVWLAPDYLDTLYREARELSAGAIAGRLLTARVPGEFDPAALPPSDGPVASGSGLIDWSVLDADFSLRVGAPTAVPYLHSIALIRRDLFERATFDVWFAGNGWREETDFYLSQNAAGARVYFTPHTVCYHLRGPISGSGGQRIPRPLVEYYAWRNTRYLAAKHWPFLRRAYGLRGTALGWTARFFARRQAAQLRRVLRGQHRSTFAAER